MTEEQKERKRALTKAWKEANRERVSASYKAWRKANPEKRLASTRTWRKSNRERVLASDKAWKIANPMKVLVSRKTHYLTNRERILTRNKAWQEANPEQYKAITKIASKEWQRQNKLRVRLGSRINKALREELKSAATWKLLGCDLDWLKAWLEVSFKPGMTWENYGPGWHVDHIRPCVSFDLSDPSQQKLCFHFTNLQPLWAAENISKSDNWNMEDAA